MLCTGVDGCEKSAIEDGPDVDASDNEENAGDGRLDSLADCGGVKGQPLKDSDAACFSAGPRVSIPGTGIPRPGRVGVVVFDMS